MQRRILGLAVFTAAAAAVLVPSMARAAVISENLTFSLSGFVDISGTNIAAPNSLVTGSITVTYDPTLSYDNDTADIVVHSLTGTTVSSPLGFTYQNGFLEFGGTQSDSDFVVGNTNDLVVSFNVTNPNNPTFIPCSTTGYTCGIYTGSSLVDAAGYTLLGYNTGWFYGVQSTVTPTLPPPGPSTGTPEPASLTLMGLGAGALALAAGRRRK